LKNPGRAFWVRPGGLINLNQHGDKGLVFAVISGASDQPRGVNIYDLQKQIIIRRLENYVAWGDLFFYDLTGDSQAEIIATGGAVGNIHDTQPYRDDRCWLFVLDQNLNPIFAPLSFGEYSSSIAVKPLEIDHERYLLIAYHNQSVKIPADFIRLVDSSGKLLPELQGKPGIAHFDHPLVSKSTLEPYIFIANGANELIKMNKNFEIIARKAVRAKTLWISKLIDLDKDGREELFYLFDDQISIYDQEFNLRVKMPLPSLNPATYFTFRETGPQNPVDVGINIEKNFYLYAYKKNLSYSILPFLSVGLVPFIFGILVGGRRLSWLAYTYIRYLRSALQNTPNGVALLDGHGMIYFHNDGLEKFLQLKIEKRRHYAEVFQKSAQALSAIQACMNSGEAVRQQMALRDQEHQAVCEMAVTPFVSPLKLIRSYLVEIKESADFASNARMQSWSNSVQKIAHEIKTPLSSVALNLTAFEMRLGELLNDKISAAEQEQLDDDIKTMRLEIKRIENLTKSFINFTNLEKPNFQIVNVRQMIEHAIGNFKAFTNAKLQIQANLDPQYNEIWADSQQIDKVLQILIENAIQALNGKGAIEISTAMAQYLDKPFASFLEFEVADTGPGIASTDHEKVFEPFYTTKKDEGTGMGLPIAKKIVEEHGGRIGLHSRPGFGAVIRFSVQLYEEKT
jgi:signal transduction histidine kinase